MFRESDAFALTHDAQASASALPTMRGQLRDENICESPFSIDEKQLYLLAFKMVTPSPSPTSS